jgi:dihydroceramidase
MTFQQDATYTRKFTTVLLSSMVIETVYHSVMNEEFVHQASWLVLLVLVAWKTRSLIQQRAKTPEQKQQFSRLIAFGTGMITSLQSPLVLQGNYAFRLLPLAT